MMGQWYIRLGELGRDGLGGSCAMCVCVCGWVDRDGKVVVRLGWKWLSCWRFFL
jgi:hypothetical protein